MKKRTLNAILILGILSYSAFKLLSNYSDKEIFNDISKKGSEIIVSTDWMKKKNDRINEIQIIHFNNKTIISKYFGVNKGEMIDSIVNIDWISNDSIVIVESKLKSGDIKTDSVIF